MSIMWFIIGFAVCLLMPAPIQMVVKNFVAATYKSIKSKFSKTE